MDLELRNTLTASSSELHASATQQAHTRAINACVEAGLVVLVERTPAFCPRTDACMGSHIRILLAVPTWGEVKAWIAAKQESFLIPLPEESLPDMDSIWEIRCKPELRPTKATTAAATATADEIPF